MELLETPVESAANWEDSLYAWVEHMTKELIQIEDEYIEKQRALLVEQSANRRRDNEA